MLKTGAFKGLDADLCNGKRALVASMGVATTGVGAIRDNWIRMAL